MFNRLLIWTGIGGYIYYNRREILKWTNYYYRWVISWSLFNPSYMKKVVQLNDHIYYYITLKGRSFITRDNRVDVEKYETFSSKISISNSPYNILEADIITVDGRKIDVLDDIKLLCGPLVNQCTMENKNWIFNYLADEYTMIKDTSDIKELIIELINGDTIKLT